MARVGAMKFLLGGLSIDRLMLKAQSEVSNLLTRSKFSDNAIVKAVKIVEDYADKIEARLEHFKNSAWGRKFIKEDDVSPTVTVETSAEATGSSAEVGSAVKMGIFEAGDSAKLVVATADSFAAADGDGAKTYVNVFSGVTGVDTASIKSYHHKGANFERAVETLVAIDFEEIFDKNWTFTKHHDFHNRARKKLDDDTARSTVKVDQYVEADSQAAMQSAVQVLAFDSTIAHTTSNVITAD